MFFIKKHLPIYLFLLAILWHAAACTATPNTQTPPTLPINNDPVVEVPTPAAERLAMQPGATTVSVSNDVQPVTSDSYVFYATQGQQTRITLEATQGIVAFSLSGLTDGQPYKRVEQEDMVWEGTLGETQDYLINVTTVNETAVPYTLHLDIQPVSAPDSQIPPSSTTSSLIVDGNSQLFLGGYQDGRWTAAANHPFNGQATFDFYQNGRYTHSLDSTELNTSVTCAERFVHFGTADAQRQPGIIGVSANWNPAPHTAQPLPLDTPAYLQELAPILTNLLGIEVTPSEVILNSALKVDLENDGVDEVLLSATRSSAPTLPPAAAGDYSIVIVRKIIAGQVENLILQSDLYPAAVDLAYPFDYQIVGAYDLNGDGRLEVITSGTRYEGASAAVFEVQPDGRLAPVLTSSC